MAIVEACGFQGTPIRSRFWVLQKCHSDFLSLNGANTESAYVLSLS